MSIKAASVPSGKRISKMTIDLKIRSSIGDNGYTSRNNEEENSQKLEERFVEKAHNLII